MEAPTLVIFGGKGGYSVGEIYLEEGVSCSIFVGGTGSSSGSGTVAGGYNGGGSGYMAGEQKGGGGGGASYRQDVGRV